MNTLVSLQGPISPPSFTGSVPSPLVIYLGPGSPAQVVPGRGVFFGHSEMLYLLAEPNVPSAPSGYGGGPACSMATYQTGATVIAKWLGPRIDFIGFKWGALPSEASGTKRVGSQIQIPAGELLLLVPGAPLAIFGIVPLNYARTNYQIDVWGN